MSEDVKSAIQDLGQTFSEFKKVNDERLEKLEKGESTADLDAKMEKIESKLDSIEEINQSITKAEQSQVEVKEQIDRLETVIRLILV